MPRDRDLFCFHFFILTLPLSHGDAVVPARAVVAENLVALAALATKKFQPRLFFLWQMHLQGSFTSRSAIVLFLHVILHVILHAILHAILANGI
jgi:hypothetical protein